MFCPTCGRDNANERKFCASCGTNLEAVSQALSGSEDDFITRIDIALDNFIARYSEHVFKNAASNALDQRVSKSWRILGQGVITSFVDLVLFSLMWNLLPLRFLILLVSTPIRLLSERSKDLKAAIPRRQNTQDLLNPVPQQWLPGPIGSVTEHTTMILADSDSPKEHATVPQK